MSTGRHITAIRAPPRTSTFRGYDGAIDALGVAIARADRTAMVHPVAGDLDPRQSPAQLIDSCLHGGVTTMVSAGEVHTPVGRATSSD